MAFPAWALAQPEVAGRDCDPAVIDSVITNNPLCPGDHINLAVEAAGDILGYSWEGPGTGTFFTFTPQYTFSFQILGTYTVIVYGECGNDTATVAMTAQGSGAGQNDTLLLCDDSSPTDLEQALGTHAEGGFWVFGGQPHSGIYDPAMDHPGEYSYTVPFPVTCPGASQTATITVEEAIMGPDTSWSLCALDTAFNMVQALDTGCTAGGAWSRVVFLSLASHSGVYDPAMDSSGMFHYAIGACFVTVQVTEWPAEAWFPDADNDGLGDPLNPLLACTQPPGHVADSSDACVDLPGTVGSPCDDGNIFTVDDQLTDSCICAGELHTAITGPDAGSLATNVWPNPFTGGLLHLQTSWTGPAEIRLYDALGGLHLSYETVLRGDVVHLRPGTGLAPGMYVVRIAAQGRREALPLVVAD